MTSARTKTTANRPSTTDADETPWYDLVDVPKPIEDGMQQGKLLLKVREILQARYADDPSAFVTGLLTCVIYDSETPGSFVAPDCFIVFGVDAKTIENRRINYRIDEWGKPPAFVLEVGTPSTAAYDLGEKRDIYARMGAQEYWRLDWKGNSYDEPLVGERLVDGQYVRYQLHTEPNGDIWSRSEVTGVDFYFRIVDGIGAFKLRESATGKWLKNLSEVIAERRAAEAQTQAAKVKLDAACARLVQARNRELEAELQHLRQQLGQQEANPPTT